MELPINWKKGGKRAYAEYSFAEGDYSEGLDTEYNMQGNNIGGGFDYKLSSGYVSVGISQFKYDFESEPYDNRTDGYEENFEYTIRNIAVQYIHEITEDTTVGLQVVNQLFKRKMSESVETGTLSSGTKEDTGEGEVSYLINTLFSRVKLSELFFLGFSYAPSVEQKLKHDNNKNSELIFGNGADFNIAFGLQTERFALEVAVHHETEQTETRDGRVMGTSMFGEFLIGDDFSMLFKIAQNNEDEVEREGTIYDSVEHQFVHFGAKLDTSVATFSGDIRSEVDNSEDDSLYRVFVQLSAVFTF